MTAEANKQKTRPVKKEHLDPRDWIPVQYLGSLYSKEILQGIYNQHIDETSLSIFVNALRRSNNGPLVRFGIEGARVRTAALLECAKYCAGGEISEDCKDPYTAVYSYLFLSKEKDPELRLFNLKRWLRDRGIKVKANLPESNDNPMKNSMASQFQEFHDAKKLEAMVTFFDRIIRMSRPKFTRVDTPDSANESVTEPIEYDKGLVVTEDPVTETT